jgi:hypothetical protein
VKALSGRQPWWWAILHAGKRIENRVWSTKYRGPILLHAAKGCTHGEYADAAHWMLDAGVVEHVPILSDVQRGGIVGRATIVDVLPPRNFATGALWPDDVEQHWARIGVDMRWRMGDQYGWVLADVEPLPFVPCKGALGLFELPAP